MKKNKTEELIKEALAMTGLISPVSSDRVWAGWELLCRQVPGQEGPWLQTVDRLLRWEASRPSGRTPDRLFIARRYLLKDGKMVFGWYLKLNCKSAEGLREATESLVEVLKGSKPQRASGGPLAAPQRPPSTAIRVIQNSTDDDGNVHEITEMRLPHVGKDMNTPSKPVWNEELGKFVGGGRGAKSYGGR